MMTRRRFLYDSSRFASGAALLSLGAVPEPIFARAAAPVQVGFANFAVNLGTVFSVLLDDGSAIRVELVEAKPSPPPADAVQAEAPDAGNEKFSLLFRGLPSQPLGQDTYFFDHPRLGRFAMFIVPVGLPDAAGPLYEAIFNRPVGGAAPARRRQPFFGSDQP